MGDAEAEDVRSLVVSGQFALRMSQAEFGEMMGVSTRTVQRWTAGSEPAPFQLARLAKALYPVDRERAAKVAKAAGETFLSLGLEKPAPPPVPSPQTPAPAAQPPSEPPRFPAAVVELLAEGCVAVAAEVLGQPPKAVRSAMQAALKRAALAGLSLEELADALAGGPERP